ncbi:adenosylhomocysteinase [Streptomyces sp. NBRC 110611]|uniref:adenosylhomocysteinase n=1 Tax=Streptomyces sp. NBRC 110611 TaxID=1621259 RepID=UPI000833CCE4|nr:adenosylhomocysteinase [Streptomyces sp. NBRC 110611]GAU66491.1 adenosylhomocysteinase [Streptomyces sp. NBRC 110611]
MTPDPTAARLTQATEQMSVLARIREDHQVSRPLAGQRLALCGHLTVETAVQVQTLTALGAEVACCASSTSTTDDRVAALMRDKGLRVSGTRGMSEAELRDGVEAVLRHWPDGPTLVLDEGALLIDALHTTLARVPPPVLATEKTPDGLLELDRLARRTPLRFPVVKSDESFGKHVIDNPHGTAQSLLEAIMAASGRMLAGKVFVVAGYGRVGSGVAAKARGLGARVVVTEVRPTRALIAALDGFEVLPMDEAARIGDLICTVTGSSDVLRERHFGLLKNGAVLANGGHLPHEIDIPALDRLALERAPAAHPGSEVLTLPGGRRVYLIGGGNIANLTAGRGNASEVMDVTFASQVLALCLSLKEAAGWPPGLHDLPPECDEYVAAALARAMGIPLGGGPDPDGGERHAG